MVSTAGRHNLLLLCIIVSSINRILFLSLWRFSFRVGDSSFCDDDLDVCSFFFIGLWYPSAFHPVRNLKSRRWLNGCLETSPLYHSIGESVFLNIMASRLEESISDLEVERVRWILKSVLESIKMSRRLYGPANGLASYWLKLPLFLNLRRIMISISRNCG